VGFFRPWLGYGIQTGSWLTGDLNGDGKGDLIHLTEADYVHPWLSKGDGTFDVRLFRPWAGYGIQTGSWLSGDFNGDGFGDLMHLTASDYVHPWLSKGDGTFDVRSFRPWPDYGIQTGSWLAGDFNGDGKTDLVHLTEADYIHPWLSNGDGTFDVRSFRPWANYGIQTGSWLSGDFNGDGKDDLMHLTESDYVNTWLSNGNGTFDVRSFRPWANYGIQTGSWQSGDFNGDGFDDLMHLTESDYVHPWLSNGNGTFDVRSFRPWANYGIQTGRWGAFDLSGDGKDDLIHLTEADYVHPWLSHGDGTFNVGFFRPWPDYGIQTGFWGAGDFDGDGKTDLIHFTESDYVHPWLSR
jgi:hypothetical protein